MKLAASIRRLVAVVFVGTLVVADASCASEGEALAPPPIRDEDAGDGGIVLEPSVGVEACKDGRFCAVVPPGAARISVNGIWGSGPDDVWIAASPDVVLHWNGAAFSSTRLGAQHTLYGIWGSGPTDIWAFSAGDFLWHSTGGDAASWALTDKEALGEPPSWSSPIYRMWGTSAADIWAVGPFVPFHTQPTVWHSTGWKDGVPEFRSTQTNTEDPWMPDASFHGVWGTEGGEVWLVGEGGKTRYTTGFSDDTTPWTAVDSKTSLPLNAVWGPNRDTVWAVGDGGVVRRFVRNAKGTFTADEVPFPNGARLRGLHGFSADDIWAVGDEGTIAHWDGRVWARIEVGGENAPADELFAIWASGPDDIWIVGRDTILHKGSKLLPGTTL